MTGSVAGCGTRGGAALLAVISAAALLAGLLAGERVGRTSAVDPLARVAALDAGPPLPRIAEPQVEAGTMEALPQPAEEWLSTVAPRTGIPRRALSAYATADLWLAAESPECNLSWATLAGIGYVESAHGTLGGRILGADGRPGMTPIFGLPLSGVGTVSYVADSDKGRWDGDTRYDRAMGPMQFIPGTWRRWGSDGDGDAVVDPHDIDDAAYSAARYLCASGGDLDATGAWTRAVLSYNSSDTYRRDVLLATTTPMRRAPAPDGADVRSGPGRDLCR